MDCDADGAHNAGRDPTGGPGGSRWIFGSWKQGHKPMRGEIFAVSWTDEAIGLARAGIWFALIFVLLAAAVALARRYREHGSLLRRWNDSTAGDGDDPGALLTKFRDLHSRGTLSDGEYRTIKTKLASQIHADLDDSPPEKGSET